MFMQPFSRKLSRDPNRIRDALQQLCDDLCEAVGEELESVILYGSLARINRLQTEHDTVNVMLVLRRVNCQTLDKMAGAIAKAEKAIPVTTITLTREDLHSSCDVFPIKFHGMQRHHRVLSGKDGTTSRLFGKRDQNQATGDQGIDRRRSSRQPGILDFP